MTYIQENHEWRMGDNSGSRRAWSLTFTGPYIANIFTEYNQQDAKFHNLFISVGRCTCFRRVFRPSSGAQNCTYSVRYLSDQCCYLLLAWSDKYLTLYVQFWAPDDGRKTRLKHVARPTEINKLWNIASCSLYSVSAGSYLNCAVAKINKNNFRITSYTG